MDYGDRPSTKDERWNYWEYLRDNHDDLSREALRDLLDDCMQEWDISEPNRKEYLQKLLKDIPN